jgi:alpha-L-rhamnosidase
VLIKPLDFGEKLTWAQGRIATDRGPISVARKREAGAYELRVKLPVNVTARVALPKGGGAGPVLYLDGERVSTKVEGDYLVIDGIGSGEHTVARENASALPW